MTDRAGPCSCYEWISAALHAFMRADHRLDHESTTQPNPITSTTSEAGGGPLQVASELFPHARPSQHLERKALDLPTTGFDASACAMNTALEASSSVVLSQAAQLKCPVTSMGGVKHDRGGVAAQPMPLTSPSPAAGEQAADEDDILPLPMEQSAIRAKAMMSMPYEQDRRVQHFTRKPACADPKQTPSSSSPSFPAATGAGCSGLPAQWTYGIPGNPSVPAPGDASATARPLYMDDDDEEFNERLAMKLTSSCDSMLSSYDPAGLMSSVNPDALLVSMSMRADSEQPSTRRGQTSGRELGDMLMSVPEHASTEQIQETMPAQERLQNMEGITAVYELLGEGTYAKVFRCKVEAIMEPVAVKLFNLREAGVDPREAQIAKGLVHDNLIRLLMVIDGPPHCLVLDLCGGGSVQSLLYKAPGSQVFAKCSTLQRGSALLDVGSAMKYLHSKSVVHRDVKSGNCFLVTPLLPERAMPPVKVGDFGFAREMDEIMTQFTGTIRYMAPEVFESNTYDTAADMFSCGILFHEIITGELPYGRKQFHDHLLILKISGGARPPVDLLPKCHLGVELRRIIEGCWDADPKKRPDADHLVDFLCALFK